MINIMLSFLLVPILAIINRIRGGGLTAVFPFKRGKKIFAALLFGVVITLYFAKLGVLDDKMLQSLVILDFDGGFSITMSAAFFILGVLGWGEYMDMGTRQRKYAQEKEVKFIDSFINILANKIPKKFIRRDKWDPNVWDTKHANADAVGMLMRYAVMSLPMFGYLAWYFNNTLIVLCAGYMGIAAAAIYYILSRMTPNKEYIGRAEFLTGAIAFAPCFVLIAYLQT